MSGKNRDRRSTLAAALDLTKWDYTPDNDRKILLRPVGSVFADLPWDLRPQYLGPAPIAESDIENESDDDVDTRPIEPLKK